jgi:hypothetical protein
VVVAAGFVVTIAVAIRNARRVAQAGHTPPAFQTDLAVKAMDSEFLAPRASVEQRLADLDDPFARGVITEVERTAARATILSGT